MKVLGVERNREGRLPWALGGRREGNEAAPHSCDDQRSWNLVWNTDVNATSGLSLKECVDFAITGRAAPASVADDLELVVFNVPCYTKRSSLYHTFFFFF